MQHRNVAVFTFFLLAAVVLAFGACSDSSTPTGTSKAVVFVVDENGNSSHPGGWAGLHQETSPDEAALCAGCHTSDAAPEPGCFNNTLCHGGGPDVIVDGGDVIDGGNHPEGWEGLHRETPPGEAAICADCHASDDTPEPGCFNNTLCHGADGDDSDEELEDDSDEELVDDSDEELEEDSDEEIEDDSDEEEN